MGSVSRQLVHGQPSSQGSLLPVPTKRERGVGERTWERGWSMGRHMENKEAWFSLSSSTL